MNPLRAKHVSSDMLSLLRAALLVCSAFLSTAIAQTGHWEGTVQVPDREFQIAVDLAKNDAGAWIGAFSQITQNVRNIPLAGISVEDKNVKFRIAAGGATAPSFDCTVENPASMTCTLNTPGGSVTSALKRTGEAKIEIPKSSPAVSGELEGNWEGSIDTPNGALRLVVHFRNQPDKTVQATLDSPDQNAKELPLTDVSQKGSAVEFQLRIANGSFKGTLNKEATQLVGEWSQGGGSVALTLKKSPK
ncbi:MAG: hypothetical protein HYZ37_18635 [Candidatus Solibacter usitatus]|nr:hypothetical protein [Candidatus Solibacter usitatus]